MKKIEEYFVALWCLVMPITNFVLIPSIPGTIPAFLLGLLSIGFVAARMLRGAMTVKEWGYFKILFIGFLIWTLLLAGSQLGNLIYNRVSLGDLGLVDANDASVVLRSGLFTQSLYLFTCAVTALYFRYYFEKQMMRYVYWGAFFMALYGVYEWTAYLILKQPADFLGNRVYGMGTARSHTGSWSQGIQVAGLNLLRIKSTFGEPSFFSAAVVPYFFLALDNRKSLLAGLLLFDAFFSTSTSCYLSLGACLVFRSLWSGKAIGINIGVSFVLLAALFVFYHVSPDTFNSLFTDKFSGETNSGASHQKAISLLVDLLGTFNPFSWLFGIGFGYVYAGVTLATFFDTGLIGLAVYIWMFWKPILKLSPHKGDSLALKTGLFGIFTAYTINVAEFYLPTTWMFLGLAYWKLSQDSGSTESSADRSLRERDPAAYKGVQLGT